MLRLVLFACSSAGLHVYLHLACSQVPRRTAVPLNPAHPQSRTRISALPPPPSTSHQLLPLFCSRIAPLVPEAGYPHLLSSLSFPFVTGLCRLLCFSYIVQTCFSEAQQQQQQQPYKYSFATLYLTHVHDYFSLPYSRPSPHIHMFRTSCEGLSVYSSRLFAPREMF